MTLRERIQEMRSRGGRAPQALQREVLAYVEREEHAGRALGEVLAHLGVSAARYSYWRRKTRGQLVPARFRPVVVRDPDEHEGREIVMEVVGVARVRGLRVAELAELLQALR